MTSTSNVEVECQRLIDLYGDADGLERTPGFSATHQVVSHILGDIQDHDYEDLLTRAGFDIDDEEEILEDEDALREAIEDQLLDMLDKHEPFEPGEVTLYRVIRVSCLPSEVNVQPVGQEIGVSWSTEPSIKDPDFLNQYGQNDGRDVAFQATAQKDQVNWLATFVTQIRPTTSDYEEIVMLPDGRLDDLVVTDPEAPATPVASADGVARRAGPR